MMRKIVELKERNFTDAEKFDYAPVDFDDAMDNYDKVLEIVHKFSLASASHNWQEGKGELMDEIKEIISFIPFWS